MTPLARFELWDIATAQHGFASARQAAELGISKSALQMMVQRGTLDRTTFGVQRFPRNPVEEVDQKVLATLWTRAPEAALSHETALDAYGISDVNPHHIHVTVGKQRRLRRTGGDEHVIHYQDLDAAQVGWWQEIPTVTARTAIEQCIASSAALRPTCCARRSNADALWYTSEPPSWASSQPLWRSAKADERPVSRLTALLRTLTSKSKAPASAKALNAWVAQAEGALGDEAKGGRLGWLIASSVAIAARQRAIDAAGHHEHLQPVQEISSRSAVWGAVSAS